MRLAGGGGSWCHFQSQLKPYLVQGRCRRSYTLCTMLSTIDAIGEGLIEARALGLCPANVAASWAERGLQRAHCTCTVLQ